MSSIAKRRRNLLLSGAVALAAVTVSTSAFAGAFGLREQSATGQGMSFAGMAAGGGDSISGMFWNPAVVNQVEHFQGEQHVTGIFPDSRIDVDAGPLAALGDSGNIGKNALLTAGYNAYRLTDQVAVGLSINTPFGLATDPNYRWAGQLEARSSRVRSVNATPTIGYTINDMFSVAVGVQIQWFDIRLRQAANIPALGFPTTTLKGDDFGVGFTAGMTFKPVEGTELGVGFRSSIKHKLDGELKTPAPDVDIKAKVKLPETVSAGIRQRVTDQLTVLGGVEWTNWSRIKTVTVQGVAGLALPFNYNDGWFFSGGAEYAYSPDLTVRTGVGYELSPVDNKNRSLRLPDDDRWWLSAGGSYKYSEKIALDLGYSYVFVSGKSKINTLTVAGSAKTDVHIVSGAIRYKFGGDAPAALVTKY